MASSSKNTTKNKITDVHLFSTEPYICPMNSLEDSLLVEILHRLPTAKFAVSCQIVCKRWYAIISSSYFMNRFVTLKVNSHEGFEYQAELSTVVVCCKHDNRNLFPLSAGESSFNSREFSLNYLPKESEHARVVAANNDLFLCLLEERKRVDNPISFCWHSEFIIYNPLTAKWVGLPHISQRRDRLSSSIVRFGFICESYFSRTVQGDYVTNYDFWSRTRVVFIQKVGVADRFFVEICCPEEHKWVSHELVGAQYGFMDAKLVPYMGKLHWINGSNIVVYDPFTMETSFIDCSVVKQENDDLFTRYTYCFGICADTLRMMKLETSYVHDQILSIWELKNCEARTWTLGHRIFIASDMQVKRFLAFHPIDEDVIYSSCRNGIFRYNLHDGKKDGTPLRYERDFENVFPLVIPWWPTPISSFHRNAGHY